MVPSDVTILAAAYSADLAIGDPPWLPHPVRAMGLAIGWGERVLRRVLPWERLAGVVLVLLIVGGSAWAAWWVTALCRAQAAWLGWAAAAALLFTCLSTRDLAVESRQVLRALEADDLPLARQRVARIVGRDTDRLDRGEIVRATLETVAESTLDGILSPLFYFVVAGVPGAVAYKAINTLDSMIGHRSARYLRFGWGAATLDTAANWLPARWSAVVFAAGARLCGYSARESWRTAWRDGHHGTVPNAGIPEAALAGALGVRLGGMNRYQGRSVPMPPMGRAGRPLDPPRIAEATRLMYAASLTGWLMATGVLLMRIIW